MALSVHTSATEAEPRIPAAGLPLGSPFQDLDERFLRTKICKKGSWIFTQGDVLNSLYIVREGSVLLTRLSASGRETILGFASPGEFFGDVPLLNGNIAHFNALALQQTELLVVGKSEFRLLLQDTSACRALIEVLAGRCNDAWAQIEALGNGFLGEKVDVILSWLASKIGVKTSEGIEIGMNQSHLAQMVGASRESLNRHLSMMKQEGILKVKRKCRRTSLLIVAPDKLPPLS